MGTKSARGLRADSQPRAPSLLHSLVSPPAAPGGLGLKDQFTAGWLAGWRGGGVAALQQRWKEAPGWEVRRGFCPPKFLLFQVLVSVPFPGQALPPVQWPR